MDLDGYKTIIPGVLLHGCRFVQVFGAKSGNAGWAGGMSGPPCGRLTAAWVLPFSCLIGWPVSVKVLSN
jgi:hypothetical protein